MATDRMLAMQARLDATRDKLKALANLLQDPVQLGSLLGHLMKPCWTTAKPNDTAAVCMN